MKYDESDNNPDKKIISPKVNCSPDLVAWQP